MKKLKHENKLSPSEGCKRSPEEGCERKSLKRTDYRIQCNLDGGESSSICIGRLCMGVQKLETEARGCVQRKHVIQQHTSVRDSVLVELN